MAEGPAVSARALTKRYGTFEAVRGIEFDVRSNECFGFLGPNGAGKTTTMKMISSSSPPSGGELTVLGMPAWVEGRSIKQRIGVIPQDNNLDEEVTVL
jgi:lipooligosaccharide transport system ATP-binding protein